MDRRKRAVLVIGPIVVGVLIIQFCQFLWKADMTGFFLGMGVISILYGVAMLFYIYPNDYVKERAGVPLQESIDRSSNPDADGVTKNMVNITLAGHSIEQHYFSGNDPRLNPKLRNR